MNFTSSRILLLVYILSVMTVASSARVMEMKAQQQLAREQQEELLGQYTYKDSTSPIEEESNRLDIPA